MKDDTSIQVTGVEPDEENVLPAETEPGETGLSTAESDEAMPDEKSSGEQPRLPRRYRLYDRFAEHVSLRTIDGVILLTAVLIVGLLIYGIVTGSPG